jgi:AraC family transcriptional regulator
VAPGRLVLHWDGPEPSVATVLEHVVWAKEVWWASIAGADFPGRGGDSPEELRERHAVAGPRWISTVSDISRRGAWSDRFVDALCDPPESFVLSSVVAHVIEFSAHRRQLVRSMLRDLGVDGVDHGDPIEWLHQRHGPVERPASDGIEHEDDHEEERA